MKNVIKEPSTWGGLGLLLTALRVFVPLQYQPVMDALTGAAGTAAVALRERNGGSHVNQ